MSSKAKYRPETDSAQVERSKDEKHFEKRVKQVREIVERGSARDQTFRARRIVRRSSPVHSAGARAQHRLAAGDKGGGETWPLRGCYSPPRNAPRRAEDRALGKDAGVMVASDPS